MFSVLCGKILTRELLRINIRTSKNSETVNIKIQK